MRIRPHHHPCARCGIKVECCGDLEQNYDGWPEWTCREYHHESGFTADFLCEDCAEYHHTQDEEDEDTLVLSLAGGTDSDAGSDVPGGGAA